MTKAFGIAVKAILLLGFSQVSADEPDWFALEEQIEQVNEGQLHFLAEPPDDTFHQHHNQIRIDSTSLRDGWVHLRQCHQDLDPTGQAQIVFRPDRVRGLTITDSRNIDRSYVDGPSVQLESIQPGARLCLEAQLRILTRTDDGWLMRNGPFMRRFLDGFYPLAVRLDVRWPAGQVHLQSVHPPAQPGLRIDAGHDQVRIDALFEGRLHTELVFQPTPAAWPIQINDTQH